MSQIDFHEMLFTRHSIRKYTDEELTSEEVKTIIEAALLAPSSKSSRPWHFTVVENPELLKMMAQCKPQFAHPIAKASLVIVVSADPGLSDVWIEDAAIAATYIQLQAEALGLGSCWIQLRNRLHDNETSASEWMKDYLDINPTQEVLCAITIGHKDEQRKRVDPEKLKWENVTVVD